MAARRRASTRSSRGSAARTSAQKIQGDYPAFVRLYDILFDGDEDLRELPWTERRARLERFVAAARSRALRPVATDRGRDFDELEELRAGARDAAIEGMMLKRRDSPYVAGRRTGLWYKWKRDPLTADCVLMYAQRGSGKRSSYYCDYTFGCWNEAGELLPVGKAYFGFTDEELRWLDRWVAQHGRAVRAGARSREDPGARSRVRFDPQEQAATSPGWRCASRGSAESAPTSRRHEADRIETLLAMVDMKKPAGLRPAGSSAPSERCYSLTGARFTAAYLPRRSTSISNSSRSPSLRVGMPARSTAEMCTNASGCPSSRWMKPKPFIELKNLTTPGRLLARQLSLGRALGPFDRHRLALDSKVGRRNPSATVHEGELQRLAVREVGQAGLLDSRDVDEHILAAVVADDEAEALLRVEEFDDALAFADDLRRHSATAAAAAATEAAAATAAAAETTAATAEAIAAAVAAATAAAEAITAAAEAAASAATAAEAAAVRKTAAIAVAAALHHRRNRRACHGRDHRGPPYALYRNP